MADLTAGEPLVGSESGSHKSDSIEWPELSGSGCTVCERNDDMGVIRYLFHRSEDLSPQRFNVFFMDMGENIHFHYRDLRIEFSVEEFKELLEHFALYSKQVSKEIDSGYVDGVLPNTNEPHTVKTFWNKTPLKHPVKYNPTTISVEDNVDGYHIHLRNYKILLDKKSFRVLAAAMAKSLALMEEESEVDVVELLHINYLYPTVLGEEVSGSRKHVKLGVEKKYKKKVIQVLSAVGFKKTRESNGVERFDSGNVAVSLSLVKEAESERAHPSVAKTEPVSLLDYIESGMSQLDSESLNTLKLKLLYLFKLAEAGKHLPFRLEDVYIDVEHLVPSVDVFSLSGSGAEPKKEYQRLSSLLSKKQLFFVKPKKRAFLPTYQETLVRKFREYVKTELATYPCVAKVYLVGSSTTAKSGRYVVPFVHFDWVKTASDFDLLVELDPEFEDQLPPHWDRRFMTHYNSSWYSHLGDLGDGMNSEHARRYPGVKFFEHMLEGYLFCPSSGDRTVMEKYLAEIGAELVFEKPTLGDWLRKYYDLEVKNVGKVGAVTFNQVFDVKTDTARYVLKVYDKRHIRKGEEEKVGYEVALCTELSEAGVNIASPMADAEGNLIQTYNGNGAVLFDHVAGSYRHRPTVEESERAGRLAAEVHNVTQAVDAGARRYDIREYVAFWVEVAGEYEDSLPFALPQDAKDMAAYVRSLAGDEVHCHGDLSPRNYLFGEDDCWLIDFQNAGYGPAILDVADGAVEFAVHAESLSESNMTAFLEGYESVRKLPPEAKEMFWKVASIQCTVKIARLMRAHHGFGHALNTSQLEVLRQGLGVCAEMSADADEVLSGA